MKNDIVERVRKGGLPDPKIQWPTMHFESGGAASGSDAAAATGVSGIGASDAAASTGNSSDPGDVGGDVGGASVGPTSDTVTDLGEISVTAPADPAPAGPAPGPSGPSDVAELGEITITAPPLGLLPGETAGIPKGSFGNMIGSAVASMIMKSALVAAGVPAIAAAAIAAVVTKGGLGSGTSTSTSIDGGGCGGGAGGCLSALSTLAGLSGYGSKSGFGTGATSDASSPFLDSKAEMLVGKVLRDKDPEAIKELTQMFGGQEATNVASADTPSPLQYADGGSTSSAFTEEMNALKLVPDTPDFLSPLSSASKSKRQLALAPLKHIQPRISSMGNMDGMARGGLPKKYQDAAPEGHETEFVTGLTGFYACGRGTGQSDCIPAMLHDGDYVMDAEAVSALGDGSSKAGKEVLEKFHKQIPHQASTGGKVVPAKIADGEYVFPAGFVTALGGGDNKKGAEILDGLREKLRSHKRSAPTSKIPPKAKSPLDYLKMAKG